MTEIQHILPLGVRVETLLAMMVGLLTALSVAVAWRSLTEERPRLSRLRAITARRLELQAPGGAKRAARRPRSRRAAPTQVLRLFHRLRSTQSDRVNEKLLQAGLRSSHAAGLFFLAKIACPIVLAAAVWTVTSLVEAFHLAFGPRLLVTALGAALGFMLPELYLSNVAAKRRQALQAALPDGLDLLVICAEAGLTLDAALVRVSEELTRASPELAEEFALTSVELNFLPERRQALANLAKRGGIPSLRGVVNALTQTERYGTPLAQALRVLSAEFRDQRMLKAEEKAARLPAVLTVPMIVFILPTLFIVLIGPAIIGVLDQLMK